MVQYGVLVQQLRTESDRVIGTDRDGYRWRPILLGNGRKKPEDWVIAKVEQIANEQVAGWIHLNDDTPLGDATAQRILHSCECHHLVGTDRHVDQDLPPPKHEFIVEVFLEYSSNLIRRMYSPPGRTPADGLKKKQKAP